MFKYGFELMIYTGILFPHGANWNAPDLILTHAFCEKVNKDE